MLQLPRFYMSFTKCSSEPGHLLVGWGLVFNSTHQGKIRKSVPMLEKRNTGQIQWGPSILIQEMLNIEETRTDREKNVDT